MSVLALAYTPAVNLAEGSSLMSLRPLAVVAHRHTPREIAPVAVLQLVNLRNKAHHCFPSLTPFVDSFPRPRSLTPSAYVI